jgi:hypothetical protein
MSSDLHDQNFAHTIGKALFGQTGIGKASPQNFAGFDVRKLPYFSPAAWDQGQVRASQSGFEQHSSTNSKGTYRTTAALAPLVACCLGCLKRLGYGSGRHAMAFARRRKHPPASRYGAKSGESSVVIESKVLVLLACGVGGTGIAQRINGSQVAIGSRFDTTKVEAVGRPHRRAVSGRGMGKYNAFSFWKSCTGVMLSLRSSHQKGDTSSCCSRMASAAYLKAFCPETFAGAGMRMRQFMTAG